VINKGFVIRNPFANNWMKVLETEQETEGQGWLLEYHYPEKGGPDILEHIHITWTETFEIISGQCTYKLNGQKLTAGAGDKIVMPPRQPHIHPWNSGDTELVYLQKNDFGSADYQAVQDVIGVFATRSGLMRDGLCDKRGRPKNLFQLMVTLKLLTKHGGYDASQPVFVQNFLAATLGTLGEMLGYKAVIEKYLLLNNE